MTNIVLTLLLWSASDVLIGIDGLQTKYALSMGLHEFNPMANQFIKAGKYDEYIVSAIVLNTVAGAVLYYINPEYANTYFTIVSCVEFGYAFQNELWFTWTLFRY